MFRSDQNPSSVLIIDTAGKWELLIYWGWLFKFDQDRQEEGQHYPNVFCCQNWKHRGLFEDTDNVLLLHMSKKANFLLSTNTEVVLLRIHLLKIIAMKKLSKFAVNGSAL